MNATLWYHMNVWEYFSYFWFNMLLCDLEIRLLACKSVLKYAKRKRKRFGNFYLLAKEWDK